MAEARRAGNRSNGRGKSMNGREAIDRAREELPALLGRPIETILGLESDDDNGWKVTVQVVELSRIPHSTDVLGAYTVTLDRNGDMIGYRREQRYYRNQADGD